MKIKLFLSGLILMILPLVAMTQQPGPTPMKKESRERIEAQRVAFITLKLNLSSEEAARFWPIYNENKEALRNLRDDLERPDLMTVTDNEATVIIERHFQMEQKRLELKKSLFSRLRTVITPRKILMLHAAEREFNKQLLQKVSYGAPYNKGKQGSGKE